METGTSEQRLFNSTRLLHSNTCSNKMVDPMAM
jgi:hypothetical protein